MVNLQNEFPEAALGREGTPVVVESVRKVFAGVDGGETEALREVKLEVAAGEFIALVGPSGCGKSTLLRIVAGLEVATAGEVLVGDALVVGSSTDVGFVFQDPNLFPWLSVRKNISFGPSLRTRKAEQLPEVEELLHRVGLEGFGDALPHHLSGGMAQRVALARALMNHPSVLLLDEPFGALDAFTRMKLQDMLLELVQQRKTTVLLVTHDIDEALYLSDRVFIFSPRPGRIEEVFSVRESHPRNRTSAEFTHLRARILELLHFAPVGADAGSRS